MLVPSLALRYLTATVALVVVVGAGPVPNVPAVKRGVLTTVPTFADADEVPINNTLSKRAELCAGVDFRSRARLDGAIVEPKDCSVALKTNGVGGSYFFTPGDKVPEIITARTNIARDTKLKLIPGNASQKTNNFAKNCDHVLEINVLLDVLKSTGACAAAEADTTPYVWKFKEGKKDVTLTITEGQRKLLEIRKSILRPENLIAVQGRVESMKTYATQRFNKQPGRKPWDIGSKLDFLAMTDYVLVKSLHLSQATAVALDVAIAAQFPGNPGGVVARWNEYIAYIIVQRAIVMKLAESELREKMCNPAVNTPLPPPGKGGLRRMARRSPLPFSPLPLSSLERRARGAAPRSGPKSRGPSCPCKQQPPKKQIPKSKTQMRPKPATKPRTPAQKPAPRARSPQKQVVKRPANRPRRTPGKVVTPRRTAPKRKPKPVPKPTRRPKGKPRPRRRK